MILMIDNYDSFTYNLVQYIEMLGYEVVVVKNDQMTLYDLETMEPEAICLSPGPGCPSEAGMTLDIINYFKGKTPILGICLGYQAIIEAFGGSIIRAERPMHGKQEAISHDGLSIYKGLPNPLNVTRYHSLVADPDSVPSDLNITAFSSTGEVMSVRHRSLSIEGVQFHPEAILTEHGATMLKQFFVSHHIYPKAWEVTR